MTFTSEKWFDIAKTTAKLLRFDEVEYQRLVQDSVARMVASITYIARCRQPRQSSIKNLTLYLQQTSPELEEIFLPTEDDEEDPLSFFSRCLVLKGGNKQIKSHFITTLSLLRWEYIYSRTDSDKEKNIYNPFSNESWDYNSLKKNLENIVIFSHIETIKMAGIDINSHLAWGQFHR